MNLKNTGRKNQTKGLTYSPTCTESNKRKRQSTQGFWAREPAATKSGRQHPLIWSGHNGLRPQNCQGRTETWGATTCDFSFQKPKGTRELQPSCLSASCVTSK